MPWELGSQMVWCFRYGPYFGARLLGFTFWYCPLLAVWLQLLCALVSSLVNWG